MSLDVCAQWVPSMGYPLGLGVVCMDLPDLESRRAILRQNLRQMLPPKSIAIKAASIDFDGLGSATQGFSGSDLHTACANATKKMLRRQISLKSGRANDGLANCQLTTADIQASISQVRPLNLAWRKRYDVWFRQKSIPSCSSSIIPRYNRSSH